MKSEQRGEEEWPKRERVRIHSSPRGANGCSRESQNTSKFRGGEGGEGPRRGNIVATRAKVNDVQKRAFSFICLMRAGGVLAVTMGSNKKEREDWKHEKNTNQQANSLSVTFVDRTPATGGRSGLIKQLGIRTDGGGENTMQLQGWEKEARSVDECHPHLIFKGGRVRRRKSLDVGKKI